MRVPYSWLREVVDDIIVCGERELDFAFALALGLALDLAAGSKRRQTTLVRQFRERIRLVHELGELRTTKEIANDRA